MKLMVSGATTTVEELLADPDVAPYLGAMVTPNTGNSLERVCGWGVDYVLDNAAFPGEKGFNPAQFVALMYKASEAPVKPVFACVPDVVHMTPDGPVGDHIQTLDRFHLWVERLLPFDVPLAFVAQDGLSDLDDIPWPLIGAVFIGGSDWFKDEMTMHLVEACKSQGKWCHLGRVNSRQRLRLALHNDVDSVDGSSLSKFPKVHIPKFAKWCKELEQEAAWLDRRCEELSHEIKMWELVGAA
jgi:hypothetical protein